MSNYKRFKAWWLSQPREWRRNRDIAREFCYFNASQQEKSQRQERGEG